MLGCFILSAMNPSYYSMRGLNHLSVSANSINYRISQEPVTDINLLMPKLCQNLTTICESSFCIPGIRKCVCDLRMPVLFGRYCLKQVDIETKCFATSQCNHTIREAVCIDVLSNAVLDLDSSKFKLDQWQQLNELRQSQQAHEVSSTGSIRRSPNIVKLRPHRSSEENEKLLKAKPPVTMDSRNSPYEFNYNTQELLAQNHTRRNFSSDRALTGSNLNFKSKDEFLNDWPETSREGSSISLASSTVSYILDGSSTFTVQEDSLTSRVATTEPVSSTLPTTITPADPTSRRKTTIKNPVWPPGICSCPHGSMFNSMLRRCIVLSLAESHCLSDVDCSQFAMTHCSTATKKCQCDEPLNWDQKNLACIKPILTTTLPSIDSTVASRESNSSDYLLPPLILAKLLPNYTLLLPVLVLIVIFGTLILLQITVKCFSSNNSALISPKTKKKKTKNNNLPPRSPYSTLRRPDHKGASELSSFTQATRGRILNYDFEQEEPATKSTSPLPKQPDSELSLADNAHNSATQKSVNKGHRHQNVCTAHTIARNSSKSVEINDEFLELNDNISLNQNESDAKADSTSLTIPAPPPTQQPPYMLTSAMKGQGSAIAAAAAAVANKRMQMAQKKSLDHLSTSGKLTNGSPVFL